MDFMDLNKISIKEIDAISVEASFTDDGVLVYDPNNYFVENGIKFFRKPLKSNSCDWVFAIPDLNSIILLSADTQTIYAFAVSASEDTNSKVTDLYFSQCIGKNYGIMPGYSDEEVNCID